MGDGLRLRFRKYQSDFNHLLIQRGAGVALRSESGTRGSGRWPAFELACWDCRSCSTTSHLSGVHDGIVSEIKRDGSTR